MKITLNDLSIQPCFHYMKYIKRKYGDNEFDPLKVIEELRGGFHNVLWLIHNCKLAQTDEMLVYFKSLNPFYEDVSSLIHYVKLAQTNEMLWYYKSLNPYLEDVNWLIERCAFAKNSRIFDDYLKEKIK